MVRDNLTYQGTIFIPPSFQFKVGDKSYLLKRDGPIKYIDWRGAGATIMITDPLDERNQHSGGPNLSEGTEEIFEACAKVIIAHAARLYCLQSMSNIRTPEQVVDERKRKELQALSQELSKLEQFLETV